MGRVLANSIFIIMLLSLCVAVLFAVRENNKLEKENESLILKNDSLHVLSIKTQKNLEFFQDSLENVRTNLTFKNRKAK